LLLVLSLFNYLVGVVKPGLNQRFVKAIVVRVLHDTLVLNAKAGGNIGLADDLPSFRGTPYRVLCDDDYIATPEVA
jgi:hypothetical protein